MTASAHAEFNPVLDASFKIATGFTLNLATIEINLGPFNLIYGIKICNSFSVGIEGIELSLLSTGFSFGPKKIIIKTPICDVYIHPDVILTLTLAFIYNIPSSEISDKEREMFEILKEIILRFFGGKPPPPPPTMPGEVFLELTRQKQREHEQQQEHLIYLAKLNQIEANRLAMMKTNRNLLDNTISVTREIGEAVLSTPRVVGEAVLSTTRVMGEAVLSTTRTIGNVVTDSVDGLVNLLTSPMQLLNNRNYRNNRNLEFAN